MNKLVSIIKLIWEEPAMLWEFSGALQPGSCQCLRNQDQGGTGRSGWQVNQHRDDPLTTTKTSVQRPWHPSASAQCTLILQMVTVSWSLNGSPSLKYARDKIAWQLNCLSETLSLFHGVANCTLLSLWYVKYLGMSLGHENILGPRNNHVANKGHNHFSGA